MKKLISFAVETHLPGMGGWGNGYVAIPKGHPCFKMDYDAIHAKYKSLEVHGGLTFSSATHGKQPTETKDMWIVGFDTLHYGDDMQRWPTKKSVLIEADKLNAQLTKIGREQHQKKRKKK